MMTIEDAIEALEILVNDQNADIYYDKDEIANFEKAIDVIKKSVNLENEKNWRRGWNK